MTRLLSLALYATTLIIFPDVFSPTTCIMALPVRATPFPPMVFNALARPSLPRASRAQNKAMKKQNNAHVSSRAANSRAVVPQGSSSGGTAKTRKESDPVPQLARYYKAAKMNSQKIRELAVQSASIGEDDSLSFQRQSTAELAAFNDNLLGFQGILQQLGAKKGLAFYDPSNKLEGLLKDITNLCKETLKNINTIVAQLPVVGPALGPIVFDIKCAVDLVLNITENLLDALLNSLQPLLHPLIGRAAGAA